MKIFYTKRPDDKILLYFLCINTLQENPTFRTIRIGMKIFCKKVVKKFAYRENV